MHLTIMPRSAAIVALLVAGLIILSIALISSVIVNAVTTTLSENSKQIHHRHVGVYLDL